MYATIGPSSPPGAKAFRLTVGSDTKGMPALEHCCMYLPVSIPYGPYACVAVYYIVLCPKTPCMEYIDCLKPPSCNMSVIVCHTWSFWDMSNAMIQCVHASEHNQLSMLRSLRKPLERSHAQCRTARAARPALSPCKARSNRRNTKPKVPQPSPRSTPSGPWLS